MKKIVQKILSSRAFHVIANAVKQSRPANKNQARLPRSLRSLAMTRRHLRLAALVAVGLILILGPFVYFLSKNARPGRAAWFDDRWAYRKAIAVTNSSGSTLTDFQVKILSAFDMSADVTAGKVQSDFDDLRFTDINGNVLNYWIEDNTSSSLDVWVKMATIPTSGATVYMYYGNPGASGTQDGNKVFEFFDDFENYAVGQAPAGYTVQTGTGSLTIVNVSGDKVLQFYSNGTSFFTKDGKFTFNDIEFQTSMRSTVGNYAAIFSRGQNSSARNFYCFNLGDGSTKKRYYRYVNGTAYDVTNISESWNLNEFYTESIKTVGNSISFLEDGTSKGSTTWTDFSSGGIGGQSGFGSEVTQQYKYFFVRKAVATYPTSAAPASEEQSKGPVAYWKFDEGTGTTTNDSTSNKNHGTISGATWQTEDMCVSGKCLKFDGTDDEVTISNGPVLTTNATIEGWFYWISGNTSLIRDDTGGGGWILAYNNGGNITYRLGGSSFNSSIAVAPLQNKWVHYAMTKNGATVNYYINGVIAHSGGSAGSTTSILPWHIMKNGTGSNFINGYVDDVKIYPYARSAAEIKADFNSRGAMKGTAAIVGANHDSPALSKGLVGYWKMDETAGNAADSSGNSNTGTWNGTGSHYPAGKFGNGGGFNGTDDYINAGSGTTLNVTSAVTISAWIKPTGSYPNMYYSILKKNNALGGSVGRFLVKDGTQILVQNNNGNFFSDSFSDITDSWTHFVYTYDKNLGKEYIYINGNRVGSQNRTGDLGTSGDSLTIGYDTDARYRFYGSLDETRIYNRALSASEVKQLYNWAPGPVAHWKMDEMSGVSSQDSSGNGNTGTLGAGTARPTWAIGKYGGALKFDGSNDYANSSGLTGFSSGESITYEAWIKPTYTDGTQDIILDRALQLRLEIASTYFRAHIGTGSSWCLTSITGGTPTTGVWSHVAVTYNNSTVKMYVNGGQVYSSDISCVLGNSGGVYIGKYNAGGYAFPGSIDDVRIYNYARTPGQIVEDMNAGHPIGGSPVGSQVGYWKFDEGFGSTANNVGFGGSTLNGTFGATTAAPGWSNDGKFGKALAFDGTNDYVDLTNNSATQLTSGTITAWIKTSGAGSSYRGILVKGTAYGIFLKDNVFMTYDWGTSTDRSTGISLNNNNWHHVAMSFASGTTNGTILYIDGIPRLTTTITVSNQGTSLQVGSNTAAQYFAGVIDEPKVYNTALTAEQVKLDYNQGSALSLGSLGTGSDGKSASSSASTAYCIPGDTSTCRPPVGEWNFEEGKNSTVNDSSGNGNTGTWGGTGTKHWDIGKIGTAGKFNGSDDWVNAGTGASLTASTITVEAWVKGTIGSGLRVIAIRYGASKSAWDLTGSGGVLKWYVSGNGSSWDLVSALGTRTINDDRWHHCVGVYDGTKGYVYIDGKLDTSGGNAGSIYPSDQTLSIGALSGGGGQQLNGLIDDVKIYNYARSPAQIAYDYNRGAPVGYWKMDECQGTAIHDSSGNNNTGTLTNATPGTCTTSADTAWYNGRNGKYNSSLDFDGSDDYVEISNNANFNITSEITLSAWIKTTDAQGTVIAKNNITSPWNGYLLNVGQSSGDDGKICYWAGNYPTYSWKCGNSTVNDDTWHHIVVSHSGTTATYYLDGKNNGIQTVGSRTNNSSTPLRIGRQSDDIREFNGQIDEVQVYNYALTSLQVKNLFNQGSSVRFGPSEGSPQFNF